MSFPENKTENPDVLINTISKHIDIAMSEEDIDRSHRDQSRAQSY